MRRLFRLAAVAVLVVAAASAVPRADEPTTETTDPTLPNVPGPFHAFNAYNVKPEFANRYHSQISQYGLEPMFMIFTRKVEFSDPLKSLLQQIDALEKEDPKGPKPKIQVHTFVVVQSDELPEVVGADNKADDKRIELAQTLQDQGSAMKLEHIDIDLAGAADLEKYKLDDYGFAFYVFQRGKITASRLVKKDDALTDADVKAILTLDVLPFSRDPTALAVTRDAALSDPIKDLLKRLDDAAEKNPNSRLRVVLALLSDDPTRNELAAKLEEQAKALMLKHVEVVGAAASDLVKYHVEDSPFGFFLLQSANVLAGRVLKKGEALNADVTTAILTQLADKAGVVQK